MKKEYDFSKGKRGAFYSPDAELNLPVYLESDVALSVRKYAKKKNVDMQTVVNKWLRKEIALVKSLL